MKRTALIAAALTLLAAFSVPPAGADVATNPDAQIRQQEEALQLLTRENTLLKEKLKALEGTPVITCEALAARNLQRLREMETKTAEAKS